MKKYTFRVQGMHCQACVAVAEEKASSLAGVSACKASLGSQTLEVTGDFSKDQSSAIANDLNQLLKPHGYQISEATNPASSRRSEYLLALPIAAALAIGFWALQESGVVNLIMINELNTATALLLGLIASVSSCVVIVGGLTLSLSANFAKSGDVYRPQIYFHLGRLAGFFFLGGAIGALGSIFQLGTIGTLVINVIVAIVLIILGLNLLDLFPGLKKFLPTLPRAFGRRIEQLKSLNHSLTPFLLGGATFFLPCGFTQSVQLFALTTGSFWDGALVMLVFALGTLPVLALLSFGQLGFRDKLRLGVFLKTAGLVVIILGATNLWQAIKLFNITV